MASLIALFIVFFLCCRCCHSLRCRFLFAVVLVVIVFVVNFFIVIIIFFVVDTPSGVLQVSPTNQEYKTFASNSAPSNAFSFSSSWLALYEIYRKLL